MKKNIALLASLFFASVVMAQQPDAPKPPSVEDRLKHFTENLDKEMTLSNEQKQKVVAAYKVFFGKMDELRAKNPPPPPPPPPPPAIKEEMDKLVADRDSKLQAVLSAEQFKTLKEMEKKRHMGPHHEMPPPPPPAP